ncbi:MAG TPA: DUF6688 family protein [Anaerolineales bacterium]|nr:DUF6688 family protein [Anaerolineales bacterium]
MGLESEANQMESPISARFPVRGWWRVLYGFFVIALPSFSFWLIPFLYPEWQTGELDAYLRLLLQPEASIFFLILLAYSVICYLLLLINPVRFPSSFVIRFGVYSGVILALQYSLILFLYLRDEKYSFAVFLLWLFPLYYPAIDTWAIGKWGMRRARFGLAVLILIAVVIVAAINREEFYPLFLALVGLVIAAPFWSFLIAVQAAIWLIRNHETGLTFPRGLGVTTWLAAYGVAWRYDILKMYKLYSRLPTAPPDCYIATAAARGHPTFVRSWEVTLAGGESMRVNGQLQTLKGAELALMAVAPRSHRLVRKLYDRVGRRLARRIQHPLLADVAFLTLKPMELLAGIILKRFIPDMDTMSIYN